MTAVNPWGIGQAILAAKELIHELFAVINADDYYGKEAFRQFHDWLVLDHADSAVAMTGFIPKNTLPENGGVTRGVYKVERDIPILSMSLRPVTSSRRKPKQMV